MSWSVPAKNLEAPFDVPLIDLLPLTTLNFSPSGNESTPSISNVLGPSSNKYFSDPGVLGFNVLEGFF